MCGRAATALSIPEIRNQMAATADPGRELAPNWNLAPTDEMYMVRDRASDEAEAVRSVEIARWGLVPSWAKDAKAGARMINARAESIETSGAFKRAFVKRRCLVPINGYYEWRTLERKDAKGKAIRQPYFIHNARGPILALAGLYEWWKQPDGEWLLSSAIITQPADPAMRELHDRMPIVVPDFQWDWWLDSSFHVDIEELAPVERAMHPVSRAVNSVANNGPELIEPIELEEASE